MIARLLEMNMVLLKSGLHVTGTSCN